MKSFALSLAVLFLVGFGGAQQLPDSASARKVPAMSARAADAPPAAGRSKAAVRNGEASFKQVADKRFWAVTGLMTGSTLSSIELTSRCEAAGTCSFMGPFDSRAKLYAIGLPANFGMMELTYRLKRSGKSYWFVPAAAATAFNTVVAVHSAHHIH